MNQSTGLKPLERGGSSGDSPVLGIAATRAPSGITERGAQALAAGNEVSSSVEDVADIGSQIFQSAALSPDK